MTALEPKEMENIALMMEVNVTKRRTAIADTTVQPIKVKFSSQKSCRILISLKSLILILSYRKNLYFIDLVDGNWGHWEHWSTCSVTCGGGSRHRIRACDNPLPANGGESCSGEMHQTDTHCNAFNCPSGPSK